jgi:hypothetical protein
MCSVSNSAGINTTVLYDFLLANILECTISSDFLNPSISVFGNLFYTGYITDSGTSGYLDEMWLMVQLPLFLVLKRMYFSKNKMKAKVNQSESTALYCAVKMSNNINTNNVDYNKVITSS